MLNNIRPDWDSYFLNLLPHIALRSHDAETRVACILTFENSILSTGYNGFIRGIDDTKLPNTRPEKYKFLPLHAELNAVLNCARLGKSAEGSTAYLSCGCCMSCYQFLYQAGIKRIVYSDIVKPNMKLTTNDPDFALLKELVGDKMIYEFIPYNKVNL